MKMRPNRPGVRISSGFSRIARTRIVPVSPVDPVFREIQNTDLRRDRLIGKAHLHLKPAATLLQGHAARPRIARIRQEVTLVDIE